MQATKGKTTKAATHSVKQTITSPKQKASNPGCQGAGELPTSGRKSHERNKMAVSSGRTESTNVKTQRSYRGMTNSNSQSNAATGLVRVPTNVTHRSPFSTNSQAELPKSIQHQLIENSGNVTPTQEGRHFQQVNFSNKNFSMRQSNDSFKSQTINKSNPSNKTQRIMQKSIESREGRKNLEAISSRERLMWTGQNGTRDAYNDGKVVQPFQVAMMNDQKHQNSSKTYRPDNQRQQQFRISTESHVSGISGILGNTQLTAGASQISANQNHQKSQNTGSERLSDEILIGCTVLQQPKQGHQHLIQNIEPNSGYNQLVKQPSNDSFQQTYDNNKQQNLLNSASQLNNQSTFSNQLQLITSNLQNKVCNSIEEAQPILRLCLTNVGLSSVSTSLQGNNFTSILSENEIDQNLVCPMCKFLVVNPVECSSCQYIICYKCAEQCEKQCFDESCQQKFTSQPGKIHKLYRAMLNQLEFRCPNQGAGCQTLLKYDQLDHHLKNLCESRDQSCPNRCSNHRFSVHALKDHIENSCPKEKFRCTECGENIMRIDMSQHLQEKCPNVKIKCEKCDQVDIRRSFENNEHDCISLLKDAIQLIQSSTDRESTGNKSTRRMRSGDQRPRAMEDYNKTQKNIGHDQAEIIMKQVNNLKKEMQNLDTIVTEDIFKMFDNMSLCVTQKDNEVKDLTTKVKKLEKVTNDLQGTIQKQTKDYEGLLFALDLKLEEKVKEIKENQNEEIQNIKRMLLNQYESDLPLQIHSQQPPRLSQEEQKVNTNTLNYNPIRGPKKHSVVPPINFGNCEGIQSIQVQDIEQDNQQVNVPGATGNSANAQTQQPVSARRNKQNQSHQSKDAHGHHIHARNQEVEEIDEENDDFVPFLSSTNDEFTDLNTDFNTDRVGESSGPQSTYRQLNSKRSSHQERQSAQGSRHQHQNQNSQQQLPQIPVLQSIQTQQSQSSLLQNKSTHSNQKKQSEHEVSEQKEAFSYSQNSNDDEENKDSLMNLNQKEKQKQDESCLNEEDMSFDNESVQNEENQEASGNDLERNQQKHNDGGQHSDGSDRSFNNNDEPDEIMNDIQQMQDCQQEEHILIQNNNTAISSSFEHNQNKEVIQVLDSQPIERRSKVEEEVNHSKNQMNLENQSNQLVSILDESSDIEQLQNDQLPGSIHGGFSHHHSIMSQGQFSVLSRGQLFNAGAGPGGQTNSSNTSAFSIPGGLSTDRKMHQESIESHLKSNEGLNIEHMHSLESLESFQVNLDKNLNNDSQQERGSNKYKQNKINQKDQLESYRIEYQKKLAMALDRNDSSKHDLEKHGDVMQTSDEEGYLDQNSKDAENLQKLISGQNVQHFSQNTPYNLEQNIKNFKNQHSQPENQKTKGDNGQQENEQLASDLKEEAEFMISSIQKQHERNKEPPTNEENEADNEEDFQLGSNSEEDAYQNDYIDHQDEQIMLLQQQLLGEQQQSDQEGNETENEVIRDHLDQLQAIGNQAGAVSALKGLDSDLETIFETDLESNYVTTARTNLSTKKLLNQINFHPQANQLQSDFDGQERIGQILMSQFSPIAHSGANTAHNSNQKPGMSTSNKDYSSQPTMKNKNNNPYKLNLKQKELEEPSPAEAGNTTDSSQSMLISNRSNQVQQVRSTQVPGSLISPQSNQCFFTHQELEQLGKQNPQMSQAGQPSQVDLDERRIRLYTGSVEKKYKKNQELNHSNKSESRGKSKSNRKPSMNNNYQEIIKEEEVEDEPQDFHQVDNSNVQKLKNMRQNLKDKFENFQN